MNNYSPCGNFIIDATGNQWPVETPHPLPLPDGIDQEDYVRLGAAYSTILVGPDSCGEWNPTRLPWSTSTPPTHWLARRPLPPVPRPKTQAELDQEAYNVFIMGWNTPPVNYNLAHESFLAALAYERNRIKP